MNTIVPALSIIVKRVDLARTIYTNKKTLINEKLIENYYNRDAAGVYQTASDLLSYTSLGKVQFRTGNDVDSALSMYARIMIISLSVARKGDDEKLWGEMYHLITSLPHANTAEVIR